MPVTLETKARVRSTAPFAPPPRSRPPDAKRCGAGDDDEGEDQEICRLIALCEDAETANGCDWPEAGLSANGALW